MGCTSSYVTRAQRKEDFYSPYDDLKTRPRSSSTERDSTYESHSVSRTHSEQSTALTSSKMSASSPHRNTKSSQHHSFTPPPTLSKPGLHQRSSSDGLSPTEMAKQLPFIFVDLGEGSELSSLFEEEIPREDSEGNHSIESEGAKKAKELREKVLLERKQREQQQKEHILQEVAKSTTVISPERKPRLLPGRRHFEWDLMIQEFREALNIPEEEDYIHGVISFDNFEFNEEDFPEEEE